MYGDNLRWPIYIVNSVHKTKLSCNTPTDPAPQFLQKPYPRYKLQFQPFALSKHLITLEPKAYLFFSKLLSKIQSANGLPGSLPVGQGRTETFLPERKIYLSQTGVFTSPEYRSVNHAVLNIEGLKLKVTAHKTFKNKFGQIRAGIKFIYCQNTSMIGSVYSDSQLCNV